nr:hypothetical protein [uncultured Treponema sp.]
MLKLKAPLIIAGATCVLSMLIGLISGVRFLSIVGRGLTAGIGTGGFVLCARIILERFIPDLFVSSPASPETTDMTDISSGANINITLDDDLTAPAAAADGAEKLGTSNSADIGYESQSMENDSKSTNQGGSDSDNGHEDAGFSETSSLSFDGAANDNDALSDLPNMDSLIDDDNAEESIGNDMQADSSGFSMSGIQTGDTDSKVMAQAIRTVLATED